MIIPKDPEPNFDSSKLEEVINMYESMMDELRRALGEQL